MRLIALFCLAALGAAPARAGDFRSVSEGGTILYDTPSSRGKKLYVVSRDYPVEVMVSTEGWARVRDASGELAWMEKKALSNRRTVVVTAPVADVRSGPTEQSALAFRLQQGVALELPESGTGIWIRVRLRDGRGGFVRAAQVWGL